MMSKCRIALAVTVMMLAASLAEAEKKPAPHLIAVSTYDTGLAENGAEIISVRHTDGLAVLTNIAGSVDVLDLSNPAEPRRVRRVPIDTASGTPNSAAIHPHHNYFLVVIGRSGAIGTVAAFRLSDGVLLGSATVGIQPDSIAIAPNGQYAVVANEAEAVNVGLNGGDGSISIVDLTGFNGVRPGALDVTNVSLPSAAGLPGFSTGRADDIGRVPITNAPATLEPESVAFSDDSRFVYVTLQENNGVVRLEAQSGALTYFGLGPISHLADLTVDGSYSPVEMLNAFREPDGIAVDLSGRFFVTADEGDTRTAAGASGPRGGRTVSVFDLDSGVLLGDTGSQLDDAAAAASVYPDSRSNRGGTEPEVLDLTHYRGQTLVVVGLERGNAVALVDVSDPTAPLVIDVAPAGVGPEGVKFFRRGSRLFVAAANEVSGTVSLFEVVF